MRLAVVGVVGLVGCKGADQREAEQKRGEAREVEARVDQAMRDEGIHAAGKTAVTGDAPEAIARSFVAVMASGDARAAIKLIPDLEGWAADCRDGVMSGASRAIGEAIGGLLVTIPRGVTFTAVEAGAPKTVAAGAKLDDCAVIAETQLVDATIRWAAADGVAGTTRVELVRLGDRPWALHRMLP